MIHIFDNFIDDPSVLEYLHDLSMNGMGLEHGSLIRGSDFNQQADGTDFIIHSLIEEIWYKKLSSYIKLFQVVGFEVWNNVGGGSNYHVDKDEKLFDEEEIYSFPEWASALYVGPKEEICGGELMINTNGLKALDQEPGTSSGPEWISVPYKFNRLVIFDPKLPHRVMPVVGIDERVSFAFNVWYKELA